MRKGGNRSSHFELLRVDPFGNFWLPCSLTAYRRYHLWGLGWGWYFCYFCGCRSFPVAQQAFVGGSQALFLFWRVELHWGFLWLLMWPWPAISYFLRPLTILLPRLVGLPISLIPRSRGVWNLKRDSLYLSALLWMVVLPNVSHTCPSEADGVIQWKTNSSWPLWAVLFLIWHGCLISADPTPACSQMNLPKAWFNKVPKQLF